jgi:hypothetical protein
MAQGTKLGANTEIKGTVAVSTREQTQSSNIQRLGTHSYHDEPKQEHTDSRSKVEGNTREQTQSRS